MLMIMSLIALDIKFGMKIPKFIEMQPGPIKASDLVTYSVEFINCSSEE